MRRVLFVGGPGAGKTAVLGVLAKQGYAVAADSAREIIRERRSQGLSPRPGPDEFARQILERDIAAYRNASEPLTFYERGVPDSVGQLLACGAIDSAAGQRLLDDYPYEEPAFVFPAWEEIYDTDAERDHTFEHAVAVYEHTRSIYSEFGYRLVEVPKVTVEERAGFVLQALGQ